MVRSFATHNGQSRQRLQVAKTGYWTLGAAALLAFSTSITLADRPSCDSGPKVLQQAVLKAQEADPPQELRLIRWAEVKKHDRNSDRPWVTHGQRVYDITDWVLGHPGGEIILRAAGGPVEPFWNIFTIHKEKTVYDILEQFVIGQVDPQDLVDGQIPMGEVTDPFQSDPARDPKLHKLTERPCNAETPSESLAEFLTPNDLFYVRNHMWVPSTEASEHKLTIELPDGEEKTYTMTDLREKFKHHKVTATLQCSGNRRKDMSVNAKKTNGLQWTAGAISNAQWEGVKLRDVLKDAGLDISDPPENAQHAQFVGVEAYGSSIPLHKAVDARGDVLLAFGMNGEELPRDHGFPLRVIVPGIVAARSVKWLQKVIISDEESQSQWQRRDYKSFGPNEGPNPDWSKAVSIQEMPVTSATTGFKILPSAAPSTAQDNNANDTPPAPGMEKVYAEGYAYSGGGREIARVDISLDSGKTWDQAELINDKFQGAKAWCWKRWRYTGMHNAGDQGMILVKAIDTSYNSQPESYAHIYNARGNLTTAWHRVPLRIVHDE